MIRFRKVRITGEMVSGMEPCPNGVTPEMIRGCEVYLNGALQDGDMITIADEDCGLIQHATLDGGGCIMLTPDRRAILYQLAYGRVQIVFPGEKEP